MSTRINRHMRPDIRHVVGAVPPEHIPHLEYMSRACGDLSAKGSDGGRVRLFEDFLPGRRAMVFPYGTHTEPVTVYRITVNRQQRYPSRMNVMQRKWEEYVYLRCGGIYPFFFIDDEKWLDPAVGRYTSYLDQRHVEFMCTLRWISTIMENSAGREAIARGMLLLEEVNNLRVQLKVEKGTSAPHLPVSHMLAVGYLLEELGPEMSFSDPAVAKALGCTWTALYRHKDMYRELRDSYVGGGKYKHCTEYPPSPKTDIWRDV
jgi:hypothetical protein